MTAPCATLSRARRTPVARNLTPTTAVGSRERHRLQCLRGPARELAVIQLRVAALRGEQLVMRASLDDPPVLYHQNRIRIADRGQTVRDDERRPAAHQL